MLEKLLTAALALFSVSPMAARQHHGLSGTLQTDSTAMWVAAYADSLSHARHHVDSVYDSNRSGRLLTKYFRLFMPMVYYSDVTQERLSLSAPYGEDNCDNPVSDALLNVYLRRPDMVGGTSRALEESRTSVPVKGDNAYPDTEIADRVTVKQEDAVTAPVDIFVEKPNFWKFSGEYSLQFFQNYVSDNWYKGGESNNSLLTTVTVQANYDNKQKFRWDNKLELRLGFQNTRGDSLHSYRATEDLLRYTGKVGLQASKDWYYTLQLIATTQVMKGLKSNDPTVYSNFLAPLYINPSVGMDYKVNWLKSKITGSIHLAPLAYSLTYVKDKDIAPRFGIDEGKHTKDGFGSEVTLDLTWAFTKDIRWKTRLYGYTTYKRMLLEWENTFTFNVNRYISSNLFLFPRFDDAAVKDDKHGYLQMKEYISLGFSYNF